MAETSKIEWTDATWNPVTGCSVVSPGCTNCYAMKLAGGRLKHHPSRAGLTQPSKAGPAWTGEVRFSDHALSDPIRWAAPRRIFVCAHGDLFHEGVPDAWIDRVFAVMAINPRHTFQVLTKRATRMADYVARLDWARVVENCRDDRGASLILKHSIDHLGRLLSVWPRFGFDRDCSQLPLPNVWFGVSAERQKEADERIPHLLATAAARRFLSLEPLLDLIDLNVADHGECALDRECWGDCRGCADGKPPCRGCRREQDQAKQIGGVDWVIAGGESGPSARPMHPDWARVIRDQCNAAEVPFFFKQWGEWTPGENVERQSGIVDTAHWLGDRWSFSDENLASTDGHVDDEPDLYRIGKRAAGRRLDGVEHNAMPDID